MSFLKNKNYKIILCCNKCLLFHPFNIYYEKHDSLFKIGFKCGNNIEQKSLNDLFENLDEYSEKCFGCKKILYLDKDIYFQRETKKLYCEECFSRYEINWKILKVKNAPNSFLNIIDNLNYFMIENDIQKKSIIFQNCKKKLVELKEFVELIILNYRFSCLEEEFKVKQIISLNFIEYLDNLLKIAKTNESLYDIYSLLKEIIIYGHEYKEISLNDFTEKYSLLLKFSNKNKFLSESMKYFLLKKYNIETYFKKDKPHKFNKFSNQYFTNDSFENNCKRYNKIIEIISEEETQEKFSRMQVDLDTLKLENKINSYLNSYFNIPSKFISKRKGINFLISELIENNVYKLNDITPNQKMIKSIRNDIKLFLNNTTLSQEIKDKLIIINENILDEYGDLIPQWKRRKIEKKTYIHPYVKFNGEEIKILKNIKQKDSTKYQTITTIENENILQYCLDFLFYLKEKGNHFVHILDTNYLKVYKELHMKEINNNENACKNIKQIIKEEIEIKDLKPIFSMKQITNFVFEIFDESIVNQNNKINFLLTKFKEDFDKYINSIDIIKEKKENCITEGEMINDDIDTLMGIYSEEDNKLFEEYTQKVEINKYYNQIIAEFNELFRINIKFSQFDKNQKKNKIKLNKNKLPSNLQYNDTIKKYQILYLKKLLYEKVKNIKEEILNKHTMIKDNYIKSMTLLESLKVINEVFIDLKEFTLNVDELFNEYLKDNNNNNIIIKKQKVSEEDIKIVSEKINLNTIKNIIDTTINSNKKINISDDEPSDFLFQLFKIKIGFPI